MQLIITEAEIKFRQDPELRKWVIELRRTPLFQHVELVFKAAHPIRQRPPSQSDSDKSTLLGRVYGFQEVLDILERLERDIPMPPQPVESNFGVTESGDSEQQE